MNHSIKDIYMCDCGFFTKYYDVLIYHIRNPSVVIGHEKLEEINNGRS